MKVWGRLDLVQGLYCQEFGACLSDPWAQPELRGGGFCHCCCWGGTVHTSWGWGLESPRDPHEQAPTPRSCAGSGRPPRVNRTTAIPPSKSPKDPDRSGSWGCDPKGRNWPGSSSPLLPPPPHRAPVPMASGSWGLSSPCPCPLRPIHPQVAHAGRLQAAGSGPTRKGGHCHTRAQAGGGSGLPKAGGCDQRGRGGPGAHLIHGEEGLESVAVHVWFRYPVHFPTGSRQIQGRTPHPNPESDTAVWLKCSLRGLLGPDPGATTGRTSMRGLSPLGRGCWDSPKL